MPRAIEPPKPKPPITNSGADPQNGYLLNSSIPDLKAYAPAVAEEQPKTKKAKRKHKPWTKRRIIKWAILTVVAGIVVTGGFLGVKGLNAIDKVFHGNIISDVTAAFSNTPLKGESVGRINILLAGDSVDDPDHQGAQLTDSILILSINTKTHSALLLSIPRDLWVYVPGMDSYEKINAANTVSNFSEAGFPAGGMGQLEEIIESDFGIPIDYYGLMDYTAFRDAVNAVGGVTVDIQSPNPLGLYDPNTNLKLPNGDVALNGQQALNLARARGDGYGSYGFPDSDFDRTEHQRQLFIAVAEKAKTLGVVTNPVKISDLINTLSNNFQTDLTLQNVLRLVQLTKGINPDTIQSYAFSSTLSSTNPNPILKSYVDPGTGADALIPTAGIGDYTQLEDYYDQLTSSNAIARESPSAIVLNGSYVTGLAAEQETALEAKGFTVASIGDAVNNYVGTVIVDNTNGAKPNSLALLKKLYPGSIVTTSTGSSVEAGEAQNYTADFVVILGQNFANTASASQSASK
jgi:LCP family protein required for cell wall assembly